MVQAVTAEDTVAVVVADGVTTRVLVGISAGGDIRRPRTGRSSKVLLF